MIKKLAILLSPESEMGGDQTGGDDARPKDGTSIEGKSMEDFVRESIGQQKKEGEKGDAQKLGETAEKEQDATSGPLGDEKEKNEEEGKEGEKKEEVDHEKETPEEEETRLAKEKEEADKAKEGDETDEEGKEKTNEDKTPEEKGPIPYERFEEVNKKVQTYEAELERLRPSAQYHEKIVEFCQANQITDDQFKAAMEIQALLNTNPEEALKRLKPVIEAVQGFTGERLPDDLQKEVDQGDLTLNRARELASLRMKSQFGANRMDQFQRKRQEEQAAGVTRAMSTAMDGWLSAKTGKNPDFKPRDAKNKESVDGMYEFVTNKFVTLMQEKDSKGNFANLVSTPQQLTDLLERAYSEVERALKPKVKKPATKPILNSRDGGKGGGRTLKPEDAKSLSEVVRLAAAGRV